MPARFGGPAREKIFTMKTRYCKKIECPALVNDGGSANHPNWVCVRYTEPDTLGVWRELVESITAERCERNRYMMKAKREVQV